jgi:hypothetical protein
MRNRILDFEILDFGSLHAVTDYFVDLV